MIFKFKKKTFTIIETIGAIFLLSLVIGGSLSLISQLIILSSISTQKLVAAYLAQEGVEIVRNIRDTNILNNNNWDDKLQNGDWEADYNDAFLSSYSGKNLKIDQKGFYNYENGNDSQFKRKISISKSPDNTFLEVRVTVFWQERGRSHQLKVQENLYKF